MNTPLMLRNRSGTWVLSAPIFDGVNTVWMCIAALESHKKFSNGQDISVNPCVSSEYCHCYSEISRHFSHLSFLLRLFSECRHHVTIQLATDWTKKNRAERKAVQVGKVKEIAANCHHSYRVRVRSRVRSRGCRVFSGRAKLARGPPEVAWAAPAPIDPTPSWANTSPEIARASSSASGERLTAAGETAKNRDASKRINYHSVWTHNTLKILFWMSGLIK